MAFTIFTENDLKILNSRVLQRPQKQNWRNQLIQKDQFQLSYGYGRNWNL